MTEDMSRKLEAAHGCCGLEHVSCGRENESLRSHHSWGKGLSKLGVHLRQLDSGSSTQDCDQKLDLGQRYWVSEFGENSLSKGVAHGRRQIPHETAHDQGHGDWWCQVFECFLRRRRQRSRSGASDGK